MNERIRLGNSRKSSSIRCIDLIGLNSVLLILFSSNSIKRQKRQRKRKSRRL